MKRLFLILVALLVSAGAASAQTGTLSAANQCRSIDTDSKGQGTLEISGTWAGTITWYVSNGVNRAAIDLGTPAAPGTAVNSTTANGHWEGNVGGWKTFEVCMTSYTSGTATIWMNATNASSPLVFAAGGGGGGGVVEGMGAAGTATGGVLTVQGVASMTPLLTTLSGANNINNISGTVSLPTGAATSANQATLNGYVDGLEGLLADLAFIRTATEDTATKLQTMIDGAPSDGAQGQPAPTGGPQMMCIFDDASPLAVDEDDARLARCSSTGDIYVQPKFAGVSATTGNGASGTGVQRVTIANDSTGIIALTTSTAQIGHLEANQSINLVQLGGASISATNPVPVVFPGTLVSGTITSAMTGTTSTSLVGGTASNYLYIGSCAVSNGSTTVSTDILLQDGSGGTTLFVLPAPAATVATTGGGGATHTFNPPLKVPTSGNALYAANVTTGSSTKISCNGFRSTVSY